MYPAREGAGLKGDGMENTREVNSVCALCKNGCKQSVNVRVVACPMFEVEKQKGDDAQ